MSHDPQHKFQLEGARLLVTAPFELTEQQTEESLFLTCVDKLMAQPGPAVTIDLVSAGSISSTVIALIIASSRKAKSANKELHVRVASRNRMAVQISGLNRLANLELA